MISSISEKQKKKKSTITLLSVGHFAAKPARILVLVRILAVTEVACTVEPKMVFGEEIVMWDISEPKSFVLRSNLPLDLEPRPVQWTAPKPQRYCSVMLPCCCFQDSYIFSCKQSRLLKNKFWFRCSASSGSAAASRNQSPLENLTAILSHVIMFLSAFWPTVADEFGEGNLLAARFILLSSSLVWLIVWFTNLLFGQSIDWLIDRLIN